MCKCIHNCIFAALLLLFWVLFSSLSLSSSPSTSSAHCCYVLYWTLVLLPLPYFAFFHFLLSVGLRKLRDACIRVMCAYFFHSLFMILLLLWWPLVMLVLLLRLYSSASASSSSSSFTMFASIVKYAHIHSTCIAFLVRQPFFSLHLCTVAVVVVQSIQSRVYHTASIYV